MPPLNQTLFVHGKKKEKKYHTAAFLGLQDEPLCFRDHQIGFRTGLKSLDSLLKWVPGKFQFQGLQQFCNTSTLGKKKLSWNLNSQGTKERNGTELERSRWTPLAEGHLVSDGWKLEWSAKSKVRSCSREKYGPPAVERKQLPLVFSCVFIYSPRHSSPSSQKNAHLTFPPAVMF